MIRVLLVVLCWGYHGSDDLVVRGTASRRTRGYAEQEAIVSAKDEGFRQCDARHRDWRYDQLINNDCFRTSATEVECTAELCGHCAEREP